MKFPKNSLHGNTVTLEPLKIQHVHQLLEAGQNPEIWEWMTFALSSLEAVTAFVNAVTTYPEKGLGMAYAIRLNSTGVVIGGTGYWHVDHRHQKLEIGGTWLDTSSQRTGANTESKLLMLKHAFEELQCKKITFSVDSRNLNSINSLVKLGAIKEGVLRSDLILHDGRERDSMILSILKDEWSDTKERIELKISKYR